MKIKNLLSFSFLFFGLLNSSKIAAQVPVANFSVSPNPACTNSTNPVQIIDLSTNSPVSWSYTVATFGPGPGGGAVYTIQNPVVTLNFPGTYTITLIATNASGASIPVTQTIVALRSPDANITPANLNSCVGASTVNINVTPNGPGGAAYTYSWSNGATSNSITVAPNVTTTYSCIVTATNGCTTLKTATITIGQPTVVISSFPVSLCPGSSATLTAAMSGPMPHTYVWSNGATTNTISTALAGVYTATATNGLGCSSVQTYSLASSSTLSITAVAIPTAICAGSNGNLHATGATSYSWNTGATGSNVVVSPLVTTTYTVIGTFGSCSGIATVVMSVSQIPTITVISTTNSICSGNTVSMTANGAASFTWNPGTIVGSAVAVSPGATTTYTVRGQNPGCPPRTASVTISVLPSPTIGVTSTSSLACVGEQIGLAASGANSYLWSNGSTSAVILVTPTVTTIFTVTGTALNNCSNVSTITQNMSDCTGIKTYNQNALTVYPNPANGIVNIQSAEKLTISIMSQTGQLVHQGTTDGNNNYTLSLSGLSDGIYFVIGQNEKVTLKQKLIISK